MKMYIVRPRTYKDGVFEKYSVFGAQFIPLYTTREHAETMKSYGDVVVPVNVSIEEVQESLETKC